MAVTREAVNIQKEKFDREKNALDPSVLKELLSLLKEKVDELYIEWQTESSEISKSEFKALINDIDMLVMPYHNINALKKIEIDIETEKKKKLISYT